VHSLEQDMDILVDLDDLRVRSAKLRDEGRQALDKLSEKDWESANDKVEDALVAKALCYRTTSANSHQDLLAVLEAIDLEGTFESDSDQVPVLRSARIMQALVSAPDSAFTESVMFLYYRVIRELYTADAPDWTIGGARAGEAGAATAFVTGECIRAILGFARNLEQTATFVNGVAEMLLQRSRLQRESVPKEWRLAETERLYLNFHTTISTLTRNIALRLEGNAPPPKYSRNLILRYLKRAPKEIVTALDSAKISFAKAVSAIELYRKRESSKAKKAFKKENDSTKMKRLQRSASGHLVALSAVNQALSQAKKARDFFPAGPLDDKTPEAIQATLVALRLLARLFTESAREVKKLINPARGFISAVLDRELAAVSAGEKVNWDAGEMAFAAASYGAASDTWDDERLDRAGRFLAKAIAERGIFPVGRPVHARSQGYKLHVFGGEIIRAFAQLLQNVPSIPVEAHLVKRIMRFFDDTKVRYASLQVAAWYHEGPQQPMRPDKSVTAVAVLALDRVNRMLDERINHLVFKHFSIKRPDVLRQGPGLNDLFYPDYGLRMAPQDSRVFQSESVAIHLERIRAHVLHVEPPENLRDPLYSMVLHGPPGTGKTTLVEALAASCGVPLVEITPSDIVMGGEEAVERRARAVFHALSLLTRVIIIFDEFDPILRRRDTDEHSPRSVFSFLTPGMLPKLKTLNKSAARRSAAYVLITNLIGTLDEAAVRSGRFDCRVGIYPPDPLSRAGRLFSELIDFYADSKQQFDVEEVEQKVSKIVRETAGLSMQLLGSRGWFVRPKTWGSLREGTPFHCICIDFSLPIDQHEPEARLTKVLGKGAAAEQEFLQWGWINEWDRKLRNELSTLSEALIGSQVPIPSIPQSEEEGNETKKAKRASDGQDRRDD
jgi:hypothetical protein